MFGRRLTPFLAVILLLGTATSPAAMALLAARSAVPAGHHHGGEHQAPVRGTASDCCDFCLAGCGAAPDVSPGAGPLVAVVATGYALPSADSGRHSTPPAPHRLPFAQGPPSLLS